jgi:chloramphenicol-sensitive protein RarD
MNRGTIAAFSTYLSWGLLPIFWKWLQDVPALETLAHRMVWSFFLLVIVLSVRRKWEWLRPALRQPKLALTFLISGLLLGANWIVYIWSVNTDHVVDASLGYFINPLANVLLGVIFLKETLRRNQGIAVGIAAIGVIYLAVSFGVTLWISLTLAFTFAIYGLLHKQGSLPGFEGLTLEMGLFLLPALGLLLYFGGQGTGSFGQTGLTTSLLLAATGIVTVIPLVLFDYGAKRVRLITLGILQYVAPSLQFLLGVLVYGEAFTTARVIGFSIIWAALALYTYDAIRVARRRPRLASAPVAAD